MTWAGRSVRARGYARSSSCLFIDSSWLKTGYQATLRSVTQCKGARTAGPPHLHTVEHLSKRFRAASLTLGPGLCCGCGWAWCPPPCDATGRTAFPSKYLTLLLLLLPFFAEIRSRRHHFKNTPLSPMFFSFSVPGKSPFLSLAVLYTFVKSSVKCTVTLRMQCCSWSIPPKVCS